MAGTLLSGFSKDSGKAAQIKRYRSWALESEKNSQTEQAAPRRGPGKQMYGERTSRGGKAVSCPVYLGYAGLNNVPQIQTHLEPQNMILFGNQIFADVISQDEVLRGRP